MSCESIQKQLLLLLYDEIEAGDRAAVEAHLAGCDGCRLALAEERRLKALMAQAPPPEIPGDLLERCRRDLATRLEREPVLPAARATSARPREESRGGFWGRVRMSPAFALALLALGWLGGWFTMGNGLALFGRMAGNALTGENAEAAVTNVSSLVTDPRSGRVRLSYDTLQRASLEGPVDDPGIRRLLLATVRDSLNAGLRLDAIDALRRHSGDAEVRAALLRAIREDSNAGARLKALDALEGSVGTDPGVRRTVVEALLWDTNPGLRVRAIDALSAIHDPQTLAVLERLAKEDPSSYVRLRSAGALDAQTGTGRAR